MASPIVHGPSYSTYVRSARLALEEKGVPYELVEVAMLQGAHQEPAFLAKNPFGKVPALEHDGMMLYETAAITRYVDRAFPGPALQPTEAKALAKMDQVIGIVDSFGYGCVIGKLVWQRVVTPMLGGTPDEAVVAEAMPRVGLTLSELERLLGAGPWIAGAAISLADLHLAPVFAYFMGTPESAELMAPHPALSAWWQAMSARPRLANTQPKFG
jgi:glutathione S-transferase